ncbi:MAG: DUF3293 domain-containing protein [Planctomycetota bacterium]|nr:DUF3293 domain-containing protein [Planctomycetota bacterium]
MFTVPEYYRTTRFRIDSPTDFPLEFVILTAHATTGEVWTDEQNQNADQRLEAELRALGHEPQRITGYAPLYQPEKLDSAHAEPGWAVPIPFTVACDLGEKYLQDALYHVQGDQLSLCYCDVRRGLIPIGPFREKVDRQ